MCWTVIHQTLLSRHNSECKDNVFCSNERMFAKSFYKNISFSSFYFFSPLWRAALSRMMLSDHSCRRLYSSSVSRMNEPCCGCFTPSMVTGEWKLESFSSSAHVAVQVSVVSFLQVLCSGSQWSQCQQWNYQFLFHGKLSFCSKMGNRQEGDKEVLYKLHVIMCQMPLWCSGKGLYGHEKCSFSEKNLFFIWLFSRKQ